ncbi:hypothetical protein [Bradyrhizobium centrolobii]|uniref:hypothetical protein n=1 Tax=Bradyrhizobium centrolobii TaxID=1505087 RepID=UPI0010A963DE|nr:hypothetical protein [Bradyrhizobium centrolobii]
MRELEEYGVAGSTALVAETEKWPPDRADRAREILLLRAMNIEVSEVMERWINSPGLRPPKRA